MKKKPIKRRPGEHKNKLKLKVRKRLFENHAILTKLKLEDEG